MFSPPLRRIVLNELKAAGQLCGSRRTPFCLDLKSKFKFNPDNLIIQHRRTLCTDSDKYASSLMLYHSTII